MGGLCAAEGVQAVPGPSGRRKQEARILAAWYTITCAILRKRKLHSQVERD